MARQQRYKFQDMTFYRTKLKKKKEKKHNLLFHGGWWRTIFNQFLKIFVLHSSTTIEFNKSTKSHDSRRSLLRFQMTTRDKDYIASPRFDQVVIIGRAIVHQTL